MLILIKLAFLIKKAVIMFRVKYISVLEELGFKEYRSGYSKKIAIEGFDFIEFDYEEFVVLIPLEDDIEEDDGEVVILKVEDTGSEDEESYVSVDDEETLNAVFEIFKEKFKDEFNFTDED